MLRAFLLIGGWLKNLGIDPSAVQITIRFPSMRDRITAQVDAGSALKQECAHGTIYGIPFKFTDPTHD